MAVIAIPPPERRLPAAPLAEGDRRQLSDALAELAEVTLGGVLQPSRLGLADLAGLPVVGAGLSRLVVGVGGSLVAKLEAMPPELVAAGAARLLCENSHEQEIFLAAGPLGRRWLCPVLDFAATPYGSWLLMPRCSPVPPRFGHREPRPRRIGSISLVAECVTVDAWFSQNRGWLEGRQVVLDYGRGVVAGVQHLEGELARLERGDLRPARGVPGLGL
jgi:hypothetical protein